jgi:hypothetical protein
MEVKVQASQDVFVQFTEEQMNKLGMKIGDKFSIEEKDGSILLTPFAKVDIYLGELSREVLEFIIRMSCDQDISVNEVINNILKEMIENSIINEVTKEMIEKQEEDVNES